MLRAKIDRLLEWARRRGQPITILDLETTTNNPWVGWMGVTEIGFVTLHPSGRVEEVSALVDPERTIDRRAAELTGIFQADVRGQPNWSTWAPRLHIMARDHVIVGYNCRQFDCVVIQKQNARYGVEGTEFSDILDAMALPGVLGKLSDVAARRGFEVRQAHRALADVWTTAILVDQVASEVGFDALDECLNRAPAVGAGAARPREQREREIVEHYETNGELLDLDALAQKYGIKRSTVEGDVLRLIEADRLPEDTLAVPVVQSWLGEHLERAIASQWTAENHGRLKPLFERLSPDAPGGFDYTQLRIALRKRPAR